MRSPVSGSGGTPSGWFSWTYSRLGGTVLGATVIAFRVEFRAMPASPTATPEHIKDVNTRYHDAAAHEYDAKWGIDFGDTGQEQVRAEAGSRRWAGATARASATASRSAPAPATSRSTCCSSA